MDVKLNVVYVPSEGVVARVIEDELIIVPLIAGIGDADDELYTMNETGKAIWLSLDGIKTLKDIAVDLSDKFKYAKSTDFEKQNLGEILEVMQRHFRDVLMADYGNKKVINILNLIEDINNKMLFTNANPKLALEILLMEL